MGAGTGPLATSKNEYPVTLTFCDADGTPKGIGPNEKIYTNFLSALYFLKAGLTGVGAGATITPNFDPTGTTVASISVVVNGPLDGDTKRELNRAFNRLLWGFWLRKSGTSAPPNPSNRIVKPSDTRYIDEET